MPVRAGPLFGAATNWTSPFPVPDAPAVTVIQSTSLVAVHVQAPVTITRMFPLPPSATEHVVAGTNTHSHGDPWFTVRTLEATVTVPVRGGPLFGATVNGTCAGPLPEVAPTVIQLALLDALQGQPEPVDIDAVPVPPAAATSCEGGVTAYVQPLACATVTVRPPMESVPCRAGPEFAATENGTRPLPLPLEEPPSAIHGAPLVADQEHPWAVVT